MLPGNCAPRQCQRHHHIIMPAAGCPVTQEYGGQPLGSVCHQFAHQHRIVQNADVPPFKGQRESFDGLRFTGVGGERLNPQAVAGELLDHGLPNAILLRDNLPRLPLLA